MLEVGRFADCKFLVSTFLWIPYAECFLMSLFVYETHRLSIAPGYEMKYL